MTPPVTTEALVDGDHNMPTEAEIQAMRDEAENFRLPAPPPTPVRGRFYLTECEHCGWAGSSEHCGGNCGPDDDDIVCPVCCSSICGDEPNEADTAKHGEAVYQRIVTAEAALATANAELARLRAEGEGLREDAGRFRALMRCGRIKVQGSCGVDADTGALKYPDQPGSVHFGAEFWLQGEGEPDRITTWGRHCIRALADDILALEGNGCPAPQDVEISQAAADVLAERRRQVSSEGWTPEHDDTHSRCEMASAAACYATAPSPVGIEREWVYPDIPKAWPWNSSWWKPGFYRHNLVKAAALLIAEIERWDRLEARTALARAATAREGA